MILYEPFHKCRTANNTIVFYDLETTGINNQFDQIVEIGAIKVFNGKIIDTFHSFVKPTISISKEITEINGIDDEKVKDSPSIEYVLQDFLFFVGNNVIGGYNIEGFDNKFIKNVSQYYFGKSFWNRSIDVLTLAKHLVKKGETLNHKLSTIAEYFGIDSSNAHTALFDSIMTFKVFIELQKKQFPELKEEIENYYSQTEDDSVIF
jgi:DNA polymerase III epsilon subunit family exonuclease